MIQASEAIEGFFRTFEANASTHNADAQISQFADVFMAGNPQGAQAVRAGILPWLCRRGSNCLIAWDADRAN